MTSGERVLEFCILGPLEVRLGGQPLALGSAKQRSVLGTLLLRAGEIVTVDELVDEMWGERPPQSAEHTLVVYLSRIRQLLNGHGPTLDRRGSGYVLDLADALLDAQRFATLMAEAEASPSDLHASRLAAEALGLWRGRALADVALGPAAQADVARLDESRLRASEVRFESELALGRHEAVIPELGSLAAQNPYRERLIGQLMVALYRSGRHADALDVYEQTRSRLDADLGLQPSAGLQQLSARMVRQEPGLGDPDLTTRLERRVAA